MHPYYDKLPPHVRDPEWSKWYSDVRSGRFAVLDFETTSHDKGSALNKDNELILACWTIVDRDDLTVTKKYKFGNEYEMQELIEDLKFCEFFVAHNAKFELQWLKRCGFDLRSRPAYCTMLGQWVLDGNLRKPRSLSALAKSYNVTKKLDRISLLISSGYPVEWIPKSWLLEYCEHDVKATLEIFLKQVQLLDESNLLPLVHVRNLTCSVLADIEFNGLTLDPRAVMDEYETTIKQYQDASASLREIAGDGVNFNSGKQLAALLYEKLGFIPPTDPRTRLPIVTAKGVLATDSATLGKLVAKDEVQTTFLTKYKEFNKLSALLTKNLEFFVGVVREYGCKFYAVFNQGVTKTGRLSSSGRPLLFTGQKKPKGVQGQNLPRQYKRLFWSGDEDYYVGEADAAQLEFRVAAALGRDKIAIDEIISGADVHSFTAQVLTEAGEPTTRQAAKSSTFSPLFGGMGKTPAQKAYAEFFKAKYKGISDTQRGWILSVINNKELTTPYGMKFYWPEVKVSTRTGHVNVGTEVHNFPVQGLATGEIIPLVLVHFWHLIEDTGIVVVNTIHDSIISLVPKGSEELYEELSKWCFTDAVFPYLSKGYNFDFVAPLGCGIKLSRNWGESPTEIIYNVLPDGTTTRKEK